MRVAFLIVCLLAPAIAGAGQQQGVRPATVARDADSGRTKVSVPIGEVGFSDRQFLNPDAPPDVSALGLPETIDIVFDNTSATTSVEVRINGRITLLIPAGSFRSIPLTNILAAVPGERRATFEARRAGVILSEGVGYMVVRATPPIVQTTTQPTAQVTQPSQAAQPASTTSAQSEKGQTIQGDPDSRKAQMTMLPPNPLDRDPPVARLRQVSIPLSGVGVDDWDYRNLRNPPYLLALKADENATILQDEFLKKLAGYQTALSQDPARIQDAAKIQEGINQIQSEYDLAKQKHLEAVKTNPKSKAPENPFAKLAILEATKIEFRNDSINRTFTITFDIPTPKGIENAKTTHDRDAARVVFQNRSGLALGDCTSSPPLTCKVVLNLPFGSPRAIDAKWLAGAGLIQELDFATWYTNINKEQPAVTFSVAFFDENATPAEAAAYVSLVPLSSLREAASKTNWTLSPTLSGGVEPLVTDTAKYSTAEDGRFQGDQKSGFGGIARLTLKQSLGSRADAVVEFAFKGGPLGEKGYTGAVTTPAYQINITSIPGYRLSFGRFQFANPAGGIAIREMGDGFRLAFRNRLAVSHIVKRESLDGTPDTGDKDHRLYLFEANNILTRQFGPLRGINVMYLLGDDRAPETNRLYKTYGADVQYSLPESTFGGTAAFYRSTKEPRGSDVDTPISGEGHVWFMSGTWTFFQSPKSMQVSKKVAGSIRFEIGQGSGDRLNTPDRDHGYIGETAPFAPDLFLGAFAGKLADVGPGLVGLRNKTYLAGIYQEERFTPLRIVRIMLRIPESDVASELFRGGVRAHQLREQLTESNSEKFVGYELFGESLIETPAGVKSSLVVSYFRPGPAIRDYFKNRGVYSVVAKVTVVLGG